MKTFEESYRRLFKNFWLSNFGDNRTCFVFFPEDIIGNKDSREGSAKRLYFYVYTIHRDMIKLLSNNPEILFMDPNIELFKYEFYHGCECSTLVISNDELSADDILALSNSLVEYSYPSITENIVSPDMRVHRKHSKIFSVSQENTSKENMNEIDGCLENAVSAKIIKLKSIKKSIDESQKKITNLEQELEDKRSEFNDAYNSLSEEEKLLYEVDEL